MTLGFVVLAVCEHAVVYLNSDSNGMLSLSLHTRGDSFFLTPSFSVHIIIT